MLHEYRNEVSPIAEGNIFVLHVIDCFATFL